MTKKFLILGALGSLEVGGVRISKRGSAADVNGGQGGLVQESKYQEKAIVKEEKVKKAMLSWMNTDPSMRSVIKQVVRMNGEDLGEKQRMEEYLLKKMNKVVEENIKLMKNQNAKFEQEMLAKIAGQKEKMVIKVMVKLVDCAEKNLIRQLDSALDRTSLTGRNNDNYRAQSSGIVRTLKLPSSHDVDELELLLVPLHDLNGQEVRKLDLSYLEPEDFATLRDAVPVGSAAIDCTDEEIMTGLNTDVNWALNELSLCLESMSLKLVNLASGGEIAVAVQEDVVSKTEMENMKSVLEYAENNMEDLKKELERDMEDTKKGGERERKIMRLSIGRTREIEETGKDRSRVIAEITEVKKMIQDQKGAVQKVLLSLAESDTTDVLKSVMVDMRDWLTAKKDEVRGRMNAVRKERREEIMMKRV